MENLVASQMELCARIARTWENLKKSGPAQSITVDLARATMARLDAKWARFDENHTALMRDHREALKGNSYVTDDLFERTESVYVAQRAQLTALERRLAEDLSAGASTSSAPTPTVSAPAPSAPAPSFPRIELPKFSGKFEDWPAFRDLFESMVIEESTLSNVRKLHYLKTSVQGEAECLLRNLPTTSESFHRAWNTLKEHFENRRLLVRSYLNSLMALPKMRPSAMVDLKKIFHGVMTTVGALEAIGRPINSNDDLLVHLVVNLLDQATRREWDKTLLKTTEPPSFADLLAFLKQQITSEEALAASEVEGSKGRASRNGRTVRLAQQQPRAKDPGRACPLCSGNHFLAACGEYLKKTPQGRKELVASHNRCFNCLGRHAVSSCTSSKNCTRCSRRHHTSLHEDATATAPAANATASINVAEQKSRGHAAVLLATIRMWATDAVGREHPIRALVDPGSDSSLIAESLAQRLRLPRSPTTVAIYGVGGHHSGVARGRATLSLASRDRTHSLAVSALILPRLSTYGGSFTCEPATWSHVQGLQLADPDFLARDPVELLLGADAYASILMTGLRKGGAHAPVAQQTSFGWLLFGEIGGTHQVSPVTALHCSFTPRSSHDDEVAATLRRFWEWEEPQHAPLPPTEEERLGEVHFCSTHSRLPNGRFQVRLPFRTTPPVQLASTRRAAQGMLDAMARRFKRDEPFKQLYEDFMAEYLLLRHMSPASQLPPPDGGQLCYLPHHGVVKISEGKPKLRVVFNGSARTHAGLSLNNHLITGANLLPALPDVILRWRRYRFAFVTDIEKMYRQIEVHPADRNYQRILWQQGSQVNEFVLNTLTYGTACAPFLAIRALRQLALEGESQYPLGAAALRHDAYVDDILSSASTLEAALQTQRELTSLCLAGGFPLRKWLANHSGVLEGVPMQRRQTSSKSAELPSQEHSVLGLQWYTEDDCMSIKVVLSYPVASTKRGVLSQVARLFDPLGWLAPVLIKAKSLLQATWLQQLNWDDPLAPSEAAVWRQLTDELPTIEEIRIPRWFTGLAEGTQVEIHGFSDASEHAYGAVLYLRAVNGRDVQVSLIQAKSKVAPLKRVSLPRLELCAAALLSKLSAHVREVLGLSNATVHHWSDSTVTLAWIRAHPAKWTTFVANRVAEIQRESHQVQWHHVPGKDNPADCVSRGLSPKELANHTLWWQGPSFLRMDSVTWPVAEDTLQDANLPEQRPARCLAASQGRCEPSELTRFSSLRRLLRVTAWILRWRRPRLEEDGSKCTGTECTLQPHEMDAALVLWVRISQSVAYDKELHDVREGRAVHTQSALKTLTPFLDAEGVLRVGGRLKHSLLDADQRHPIILASSSHLSQLIVDEHHRRTLHSGTQATLSSVRRRFWIPRGRQLVKHWIHRCTRCLRWRAASPQPVMGGLPAARVTPSRPFLHTGVDYAGPIKLRTTRGRGHRSYKGFMSIFVCFSTRAVHLEAVSDYTAVAFLAAFRRFSSRRGLPTAMYSDQGTTFVGADNELRALFSSAAPDAKVIASSLANEGVRWKFNPPAAPHFGGLWEAAVRSVKHHVRRVIGDAALTFEEMSTLLAEVEACLNSRPLQAITDDPEDLSPLTPGHFLVGEPLRALPEPTLTEVPANRLSRWRILQRMRDHLWARWSQEYLQSLTPRKKWWKETGGVREGQLCLIKGDNSSPTCWPLARIVRLHRGADGHVRVVDVKTAAGALTRPVVKIVPLPDASANEDQSA